MASITEGGLRDQQMVSNLEKEKDDGKKANWKEDEIVQSSSEELRERGRNGTVSSGSLKTDCRASGWFWFQEDYLDLRVLGFLAEPHSEVDQYPHVGKRTAN